MPHDIAISCRGLRKRYPDVVAVDGLDLEVRRGECFGLLGPNGAGKTTTIEIIEGLTRTDEGDVEVLGRRWGDAPQEIRERIGVSLQETKLSDKLTVRETLILFRALYDDGRPVDEVIAQLALEEKQNARVEKLSGGQKQRLAVACALVGDPEILFLDEPTTGLDPQSRLQLWDQITRFRAAGRTVLLTTHYMDEAERLCDRIAIIDHGRRIALGTPSELIALLRAPEVIEFAADPMPDEPFFQGVAGVRGVHRRGGSLALHVDSLTESVPALLARLDASRARLAALSTHRATLEDVFVALTGRELREE